MTEFETRENNIDGIEHWTWIKGDDGAWEGPMEDWRGNNGHKHKIMKYCKHFNVVVQAGGCMGMYPRLLSNLFDVVYTFEPVHDNFYCLVQNTVGRKVISFNAAVGDTPGLVSMYGGMDSNRGTASVETRANSFIPQLTIDQIKYRSCDLLMLDIEGYEGAALVGAMETMYKFNPVVFVEKGWIVEDWMKKIGYEKVDKSGHAEVIFVREKAENT